ERARPSHIATLALHDALPISNAEAAHRNFAPAPGQITSYREPAGPGVRVDSGVVAGSEVTPLYDPLIAKLIVWDTDRERATARVERKSTRLNSSHQGIS